MSTFPQVDASVDTGDRQQPVATVEAGQMTITVYASLTEPGRVVVEIDGDTEPLKLYVNDGQLMPGVPLTRQQLEAWAGRRLTDTEVDQLDDCVPNSSIPEAVATIVDGLADGDTSQVPDPTQTVEVTQQTAGMLDEDGGYDLKFPYEDDSMWREVAWVAFMAPDCDDDADQDGDVVVYLVDDDAVTLDPSAMVDVRAGG